MSLDPIDKRILALLQSDGRMGFQELGEAVGLSGPAAFQRARKLEGRGVITGFHARVDPAAVGRGRVAFARVVPGVGTQLQGLVRRWAAVDDILECHRVGPDGAYLLKLRVPLIQNLVPHLDAVRKDGCTATIDVGLESVFERWILPVR